MKKPQPDFGLNCQPTDPEYRQQLISYISFKLATHGLEAPLAAQNDPYMMNLASGMVQNFQQKNRLLDSYLPPADQRIQSFLVDYLSDVKELKEVPRLPGNTIILDQYGIARELSLPPDKHEFHTDIIHSYRLKQGVLHNPKHDRRTTKGVFHVAEGGLPVPADKKEVPKIAFARLLAAALSPPDDLSVIPFASETNPPARRFVSLLLRPLVQPEVEGILPARYSEIRFFAPGNLVANLDFVESIFGNAGDPYLPENDSAMNPVNWTGHTGCIILATHMIGLKKKDLGLPNIKDATERQKKDGMCWEDPEELYNDGTPFKITCRDERGIMVTLIGDNYFGYSKKEVKTQISYSANLLGLVEEEHAGGALAFPSYNLGMKFVPDSNLKTDGQNMVLVQKLLGDSITVHPEGYAIDRNYQDIIYLPEDAILNMDTQQATWTGPDDKPQSLRILPHHTYIHPSGYKIELEQHPGSGAWRLVGTVSEGTLCHKPCTVSGGGKSEISKSIWDAIHFTPLFIADYDDDMRQAREIIERDYSDRFITPPEGPDHKSRTILSKKRSLGSVIKLLTPAEENTKGFNTWLESIPHRIKALVFLIKRFYQEEWGDSWRQYFTADVVNGSSGNILKFKGRPVLASYLRVGLRSDGTGWTHKLRQDFMPSKKVQWEDDISASVVLPQEWVEGLNKDYNFPSIKFTQNCEFRFFQRPDEAIHRGYDKQAEKDLSVPPVFVSNFEPFPREAAREFIDQTIAFTEYTEPVQDLLYKVVQDQECEFFALSSHPRIFEGAPSKNPRYLQTDPAVLSPRNTYLANIGTRLARKIPKEKPVHHPVNAVLPGRRNNPSDHKAGIRPLAVYGPIHYQELPELFMDFISSLTGKSPSTTGAGSEGALTKGPFNALVATTDLNNALLSYILIGFDGFTSAAGYIGPHYRVDHDVSLLIPELWSRLNPSERNPKNLIASGSLERLEDFDYKGEKILASRLGYRITHRFAINFFGRIFDSPQLVFNEEMLKPETQSMEDYVDGIKNIVETQQKVAQAYITDGSVEGAIPPLKALLYIMAEGTYQGKTVQDPEIRKLFDRKLVLSSDWYAERLKTYQKEQMNYLQRQIDQYWESTGDITQARDYCQKELARISSDAYLKSLIGTIGRDVIYKG